MEGVGGLHDPDGYARRRFTTTRANGEDEARDATFHLSSLLRQPLAAFITPDGEGRIEKGG